MDDDILTSQKRKRENDSIADCVCTQEKVSSKGTKQCKVKKEKREREKKKREEGYGQNPKGSEELGISFFIPLFSFI
jgi:hypothetical protein